MRKSSRNTITVPVYSKVGPLDATFPAKWVVCPACDGRATTTRHIECDGGGFTGSEWAEACCEDEDFADKYFSGAYDRACDACKGRSTVQEIDEEAVYGWREKILLKAYYAQMRDNAEIDAMHAAERRMGA